MSGACPAPGPDDPLVRGLIGVVDCNVQSLIQAGYGGLFNSTGAFANVLTVAMILYVAFIGYRLMLGQSPLNITDLALTAVKLGVVIALATQWGVYQQLVYHVLFYGPQQIADVILHDFNARSAAYNGDVFDGLQRAFVDLTSFSPATPAGAAAATPGNGGAISTLLSKSGFDSLLLLISAVILLVSSLGVLLASKIVLGMLLATGPLFIALLLFDSTRGVFEGWLRASLAFAFAPLAVTLMLGVSLTLMEPTLEQVETMRASNTYIPGVAFAAMVLVLVFAGVAVGMVGAAGVIAAGFRLPRPAARAGSPGLAAGASTTIRSDTAPPGRAARTASAVAAQARRDARLSDPALAALATGGDRRASLTTMIERGAPRETPKVERLGQAIRRQSSPRAARSGARSEPR
jgi:type IV secretion system protein VirB6